MNGAFVDQSGAKDWQADSRVTDTEYTSIQGYLVEKINIQKEVRGGNTLVSLFERTQF